MLKLTKIICKVNTDDQEYLKNLTEIHGKEITKVSKQFASTTNDYKRTANIQRTSLLILEKLILLKPIERQQE